MAYDVKFYRAYEKYLKEKSVRKAHDWIFSLLSEDCVDVIDLGCGQCQEFQRYCYSCVYYDGIDKNIDEYIDDRTWLIHGDYRNKSFLKSIIDRNHRSFVSLFSSEITKHYTENYHLYNWIFKMFPNIRSGLVSGFYYTHKKHKNPIKETGGIVSYQTLESVDDCNRNGYTEKRIILPVPSEMFGPYVMEVWKLFERV